MAKAGAASRRAVKGEHAASIAVETEIATAGSQPGTRDQGKEAVKRNRTRRRKRAQGRKPPPAQDAQADVPRGLREENTEAEDRAAVGAPAAPFA